ncbi:hypothetical protein Dsin_026167 [Dipteronia sinensis]|uniref:Uncharacterized protein n=1 Tax=Dipteronia sinensis TaxID=43782 RepID=A0AAD9ZX49_9ROSI|nr:hypothetical protein Dsin_026167 [Dipteronia sinensis]
MLILLTLFQKMRGTGFKDVKVMDLETFLEKLSASEARNELPEVGFRGEQELMQTGNDEAPTRELWAQHPAFQKINSIRALRSATCSEKLKDYHRPPVRNASREERSLR